MLTGEQVRSARTLLSWSEEQLADAACLSVGAVRDFEEGAHMRRQATSDVLRRALEAAGAEFIAENGSVCVHFRKDPHEEGVRPDSLAPEIEEGG
jgi:transcriptional regulator with XRE-family HTH domain